MLQILTIPSSTEMISSVSEIANPWFSAFLPIVYIGIGIFAFAILLVWFKNTIISGLSHLFSHEDRAMSQADEEIRRTRNLLAGSYYSGSSSTKYQK